MELSESAQEVPRKCLFIDNFCLFIFSDEQKQDGGRFFGGGNKEINKEIRSDPSSQASPASPPLPPFFEVFEYTLGTLAGFGAFVLMGAAFWSDGGVFGGGKEVVRKRQIFFCRARVSEGKNKGRKNRELRQLTSAASTTTFCFLT